jgi:hypothetical protein
MHGLDCGFEFLGLGWLDIHGWEERQHHIGRLKYTSGNGNAMYTEFASAGLGWGLLGYLFLMTLTLMLGWDGKMREGSFVGNMRGGLLGVEHQILGDTGSEVDLRDPYTRLVYYNIK